MRLFPFTSIFENFNSYTKKPANLKKIRFLTVGLLNTIFGYGVYSLLIYFEFYQEYALLLSTISGIIFNYFSFRGLVFKIPITVEGIAKYIFTYCILYFFNVWALSMSYEWIVSNSYIAQLICLPFLVLISWILMNRWVFK